MLDQITIKTINDIAESLLDAFNIQIPINDIEGVVNKIGGRVEIDVDLSMYSDGFIKKENDAFVISVSPFQSNERKNFTIAHELGHLFLHMGYITDEEVWEKQDGIPYHRNGSSIMEYQANEFAAAFLMPKSEYKKLVDLNTNNQEVNTSRVAEYFNVSLNAASNRGKWLGYLQW